VQASPTSTRALGGAKGHDYLSAAGPSIVPSSASARASHRHSSTPKATRRRLNAPSSAHTPRCQSDVEVRARDVGGDGEVFADDREGMHDSGMDAMGRLGGEEVIDFRTSLP
jgi:hypothetical protein